MSLNVEAEDGIAQRDDRGIGAAGIGDADGGAGVLSVRVEPAPQAVEEMEDEREENGIRGDDAASERGGDRRNADGGAVLEDAAGGLRDDSAAEQAVHPIPDEDLDRYIEQGIASENEEGFVTFHSQEDRETIEQADEAVVYPQLPAPKRVEAA